jgi:hypothetical protein
MKIILCIAILMVLRCGGAYAQTTHSGDSVMVTIFLKHQQDKNLDSIQMIEKKHKFLELFPPKGARIISWYVMMGIGQVVTVKITGAELRTLNLSIEHGAWGAFDTEFYLTYDYLPEYRAEKAKQN